MSSRVLRPGDPVNVAPVDWRQVGGAMERAGPANAEQPGLGERLAQMESQYREANERTRAAAFREGESAGRKQAAAEVQPRVDSCTSFLLKPRLPFRASVELRLDRNCEVMLCAALVSCCV